MMILTAREATEFALTPIRTSLEQLGKEMTELTEAKIDMQAKIQQLTEQLDQAKDTVGDAVEVRLARLEKAQEGLMSVIENLTAEMGSGQEEEDNEEPEASTRLSASIPPVSPAHGETHGPSILQMFPIADSVKSHQRSKEEKGKFVDPLGGEDKGLKGDVSAKVQADRPTYTMHSRTTFAILHCDNRWSWHVRCNQCSSSRCSRSEGGSTSTLFRHNSARSPELADTDGEVDGTPELSCGQICGSGGKSDGGSSSGLD